VLQVGLLQLHGTGTALGDPIEVNAALSALFSGEPKRPAPLALAAVKSAAGHCEAAAGMVGLVCAVGVLETRQNSTIMHLRWGSGRPKTLKP
jgi:acyl transferase domain-containing protein